jgi:DNA-directed RNA polymerase subunit RPC12/RpoP
MYGGKQLKSTNVAFTNAKEDPWQHASITASLDPNLETLYIDCPDCGHCIDLKVEKEDDSSTLKST